MSNSQWEVLRPLLDLVGRPGPKFSDLREALSLAERSFVCPCALVIDRDVNAAINLARWSARFLSPPQPVAA